jgi:tRNA threonylcarbamoyladenosine biosynthesis protein TsaB
VADRVVYDLGIDTASDDVSIALLDDAGHVTASRAWRVQGTVALELLGGIDALLTEAGVERTQIARIAVDVGPGQYGPIRTGIATAQGLALALDASLAGIGRLEADAWALFDSGVRGDVVAIHDAGRAGVAWAAYRATESGVPHEMAPPRIDPVEVAAREAPRPATWCGEQPAALAAARDVEGRSSDTVSEVAMPRAVALVRLARLRDAFGDPSTVDALYLRPPSITRPKPRG